jgi:hypothetical protein
MCLKAKLSLLSLLVLLHLTNDQSVLIFQMCAMTNGSEYETISKLESIFVNCRENIFFCEVVYNIYSKLKS